jgi:nucleotide-binding universal stress UspA family protein
MYASVLVPVDGSAAAATAVPLGLEIARRFGARLVLLRVVPESGTGAGLLAGRDYDSGRSQAEGYLDGLRRSLRSEDVKVERVIGTGDPATVILKTAEALGQPLIVLTAYGRSASQEEGAIGKVADDVLRHAGGAVVLVRPEGNTTPQAVQEAASR